MNIHRLPAAPLPARCGVLVLLVALVAQAAAARVGPDGDASPEEQELVEEIVQALRRGNDERLMEHLDSELRHAERVARGLATRPWQELDDIDRLIQRKATIEAWLDDERRFMDSAVVKAVWRVDDPATGRGAVPDRRVLQALVKSTRLGQFRDVLVVLTQDDRLLDLVLGPPYVEGNNPAGEVGLLPEPWPSSPSDEVRWPADIGEGDREAARELVATLLDEDDPDEQALIREYLHRTPEAAAAALVEQLLELDAFTAPDAILQARLIDTLETITGRSSDFRPIRPFTIDVASWRAHNSADIAAWKTWHDASGGTFLATRIEDPIEPTFGEEPDHREPVSLPRWEQALAERGEAEAGGRRPDRRDDLPPPPVATARAATPPPPPVPLLSERASELTLLYGDRIVRAGDVAEQLPAPVRAALDTWASTIDAFAMSVAVTGTEEHVLIGVIKPVDLIEMARLMDRTWELLHAVVPRSSSYPLRATVGLLYDDRFARSDDWKLLLEDLVERRILHPMAAEELRREPGGHTARNLPMFLQPTWDQAGSAGAGDDEFRLVNELSHKYAQCLVTNRVGELPPGLLWALGHFTENRLFGTVYQFNTTGFVSSGDHTDWPTRSSSYIDKRSDRRDFDLAERVLLAADPGAGSIENPLIAWGVVEYLIAEHPAEFEGLLLDMTDIQLAADEHGMIGAWLGDPEETHAALSARLQRIEIKRLIRHLQGL